MPRQMFQAILLGTLGREVGGWDVKVPGAIQPADSLKWWDTWEAGKDEKLWMILVYLA